MSALKGSPLKVTIAVGAMLVALLGWGVENGTVNLTREVYALEATFDFKCYEITPGTAVNAPVTLFDQFHPPTCETSVCERLVGGESVRVQSSQMLCTPTVKVPEGGTTPPLDVITSIIRGLHLKCHKIVPSGPPVNEQVTLTDQFGTELATVRTPQLLCGPVQKCLEDGTCFPE